MPFSTGAVTATTTAQKIIDGKQADQALVVNTSTTTSIYVGGEAVTAATGIEVPAGGQLPIITPQAGDNLYAITASGSAAVRVLAR
jgi:hypothetical protein